MRIFPSGREYVHWPYTADTSITSVDVLIDAVWHAAIVTSTQASLLVAGPDAVSNPGGTVVLALGEHDVLVRFNDAPETPVRSGGRITVQA